MHQKYQRFAHIKSSAIKQTQSQTTANEATRDSSNIKSLVKQKAEDHAKSLGLNNVPFWLSEIVEEMFRNKNISRSFL